MRLLTDEVIKDIIRKHAMDYSGDTMKYVLEAQDAKTLKAVGEWIIKLKYLPVKYPFKSEEIGVELLEGEEGGIVYFPIDVLEEVVHKYLGGEMPE